MEIQLNKDNYVNLLQLDTIFKTPAGNIFKITKYPVSFKQGYNVSVNPGYTWLIKDVIGSGTEPGGWSPNINRNGKWAVVLLNYKE